jgi:hypothetical protein
MLEKQFSTNFQDLQSFKHPKVLARFTNINPPVWSQQTWIAVFFNILKLLNLVTQFIIQQKLALKQETWSIGISADFYTQWMLSWTVLSTGKPTTFPMICHSYDNFWDLVNTVNLDQSWPPTADDETRKRKKKNSAPRWLVPTYGQGCYHQWWHGNGFKTR